MAKLSVSDAIGVAGIVLMIILLVLDKAGRLKGGWLLALLCLAGAMTFFIALGNSWVMDAPDKWRFWRGALMVCLVSLTYSGLIIWITFPSEIRIASGGEASPVTNRTPTHTTRPLSKEEGAELYAQVLGLFPGPVYQFYKHPPVYFKRLDTMLYVSITNQTDIPLYLRRYSASAFVGGKWIAFKNADPSAYWADEFGAIIPSQNQNPAMIKRFDLSKNGYDYVMNQRPLGPHENLRLWMFFMSGIGDASEVKNSKFRLTFYDSTNNKYVCVSQNHSDGITIGPSGSGADLTYLPPEPVPANLREEPVPKVSQ
ncbi:MAG TPA: hypothetical protein VKS20_14550 [Candidatus Acidoferrales bacterium]|nr:hypothetical protein [Candidatus Acidoferrales bacterium]